MNISENISTFPLKLFHLLFVNKRVLVLLLKEEEVRLDLLIVVEAVDVDSKEVMTRKLVLLVNLSHLTEVKEAVDVDEASVVVTAKVDSEAAADMVAKENTEDPLLVDEVLPEKANNKTQSTRNCRITTYY